MKMYIFKFILTHDGGKTTISINAGSGNAARDILESIENCPPQALKLIKKTEI